MTDKEMWDAILTLARAIEHRIAALRANGADPQVLIDSLTDIEYELAACQEPDGTMED